MIVSRERGPSPPCGEVGFLALLSTNLIMYWSGWAQVWKMMLAIALGYILLGIFQALDKGHAPQMDFRHGYWVLIWFAGITVISYLGKYSGTSSAHAGQLNWLGFAGGIIATVILTVIVLAIAWTCQLPGYRVRAILAESDNPESVGPGGDAAPAAPGS